MGFPQTPRGKLALSPGRMCIWRLPRWMADPTVWGPFGGNGSALSDGAVDQLTRVICLKKRGWNNTQLYEGFFGGLNNWNPNDPGTQMTLILSGKGLLFGGSNPQNRGHIEAVIWRLFWGISNYKDPCGLISIMECHVKVLVPLLNCLSPVEPRSESGSSKKGVKKI